MDLATSLYNRLAPYRAYELQRPGALQRAYKEREEIVASIIAGDSDSAYKLLVEHVRLDNDIFSDLISTLNTFPHEPLAATARSR
jgi:DNA-binding GntR family transcriptional regulator